MNAKPETTVCLLNWRRPHNVHRILAALRAQSPAVEIFVWNNGEPEEFNADWIVQSSRNLFCLPRWWMACQAQTRLVVILDDDLFPARVDSISRLAACCQPTCAVGPIGAVFGDDYSRHTVIREPDVDSPADLIKGRCMAMHTDTVRRHAGWAGVLTAAVDSDLATCEDIAICGAISEGRRGRHLVPGGLAGLFTDLSPDGPEALSRRTDHMARRDRAARRYFR